ncbi:helix-turn-helix domain-containing protein [Ruegeria sp. Ofav3-42]|uniref:helix-turn-helix domain-containing protein n=1 Tax=Ruegeria sp. Ofav3-42 TaxID=2917759 RepID=UPI001EF40592|nr:helix-turn-helix transcriptional regulator [Ruegeria sp. Ofav3-42]MCG7518827.1 short-chain fatty acyl-CoA regulator family protein [Ruegeria sp. Ofav3-42]
MRDTLTGSRIRERRQIAGLRQASLARQVGISASYLNLIEHNRRRIGGKLLVDIANALAVEPSLLTQGIEATLISALREAAADAVGQKAEVDGLEEFAGRFPGWAGVLAQMHRRVVSLERTVETLSDRLTHDPHLAASMHEVLSTAAAIRSTAAILAETQEIEPEWQDRFHRNLHQDAERLADSSKSLVAYLDDSESAEDRRGVPSEDVEAFFDANGHHFPQIEEGGTSSDIDLSKLDSSAARSVTKSFLDIYVADARAMPLAEVQAALTGAEPDPLQLAARFSVDVATVLRRLAALPEGYLGRPTGLVVCDASGSILFSKPVPGFAMPRFGEACPLWPVFQALSRPLVPIRKRVVQLGRTAAEFDCYAYAWPQTVSAYDDAPVYHSVMLVRAVEEGGQDAQFATRVGPSCRVCPNGDCKSRREPSILSEGF